MENVARTLRPHSGSQCTKADWPVPHNVLVSGSNNLPEDSFTQKRYSMENSSVFVI